MLKKIYSAIVMFISLTIIAFCLNVFFKDLNKHENANKDKTVKIEPIKIFRVDFGNTLKDDVYKFEDDDNVCYIVYNRGLSCIKK